MEEIGNSLDATNLTGSVMDEELSERSLKKNYEAGREILIMTIDIGNGQTDELLVHEEDEPEAIARFFCIKHSLGPKVKEAIQKQIEYNIERILNDESCLEPSWGNISPVESPKEVKKPKGSSQFTYQPNINQRSKQMAQGRFAGSVHERLHNLSKKSESPPKRTPARPKARSSSMHEVSETNYGTKLYYKGLKMQEKKDTLIQVERQKKYQSELNGISFKPKINSKRLERSQVPEFYLIQKGKEKLEHIEKLKGLKLAEEKEKCTFRPQIDKRSSMLAERKASPDRHLQLYREAQERQAKLEKKSSEILGEMYPFKPNTQLTQKQNEHIYKTFSERRKKLSQSRRTLEDYIEQSRSKDRQDPKTGQDLFKPKVGRAPKERKVQPGSIGEHLYSLGKRSASQTSIKDSLQPTYTTKHSDSILRKLKHDRFNEIFTMLGPDSTGNISKETVESCQIPHTLKAIIQPLLEELVELDEKLNFEEFCNSMESLMATLTPGEKSVLLMIKKDKKPGTKENLFKPSLISKSAKESPSKSLYERYLEKKQEKEAKVQEEKKASLENEMEQCTFKPKITKYRLRNQFSSFEEFSPERSFIFKC